MPRQVHSAGPAVGSLHWTAARPGRSASPVRNDSLVEVQFNERLLQVPGQCSVAAALLAAGVSRFRSTPVSGAARAPYCMMGVCFECLLEIDGVANRQACLVQVQPGMKIRSQEGARHAA